MKTEIFESYPDFLDRLDKDVNGATKEFADANPGYAEEKRNKGCWNCSGCYRCYGCSRCSGKSEKGLIAIPKIENIHSAVRLACSKAGALDMGDWHTCDTTHCRAGWVVWLAGDEGRELEKETSTEFAAKMIYKESSGIPVSPVRFHEADEVAMKDIEWSAKLERESRRPAAGARALKP